MERPLISAKRAQRAGYFHESDCLAELAWPGTGLALELVAIANTRLYETDDLALERRVAERKDCLVGEVLRCDDLQYVLGASDGVRTLF